jgi:hypothetical protein
VFNRDEPGYHDLKEVNWERDLPRFDGDPYKTKWLESCYNPEFHMRVNFPKRPPNTELATGGIAHILKTFKDVNQIF